MIWRARIALLLAVCSLPAVTITWILKNPTLFGGERGYFGTAQWKLILTLQLTSPALVSCWSWIVANRGCRIAQEDSNTSERGEILVLRTLSILLVAFSLAWGYTLSQILTRGG